MEGHALSWPQGKDTGGGRSEGGRDRARPSKPGAAGSKALYNLWILVSSFFRYSKASTGSSQ